MECWIPREYNYVKTRDNKRNPCHILQPSREEGNAVDFSFSLSEITNIIVSRILSHSLTQFHYYYSFSLLLISIRKNRDTLYVSQSHYPPPLPSLVLSIPRFVCHFTRPPDKLPSPKNRFAAGRRSFKRPIPIIIICLISDKRWTNVYPIRYILFFLLLNGRVFFFPRKG